MVGRGDGNFLNIQTSINQKRRTDKTKRKIGKEYEEAFIITSRHMKKYSISFIIKEMEIEVMSCILTQDKMETD